MWYDVLDMIATAVTSAFGWFGDILEATPGAWDTIFTLFVILVLSRYLLGPILGAMFRGGVGSDTARKKQGGNDE